MTVVVVVNTNGSKMAATLKRIKNTFGFGWDLHLKPALQGRRRVRYHCANSYCKVGLNKMDSGVLMID